MNLDIDEDFPTHPKSVRLCAALQHPVAWAYMIKLWSWARKYQADGNLSGYTPEEIEFSIGWTLADGKFYAAAVRAGFIDEAVDGQRTIHNWMNRTGGAIQRMEAGAKAAKERRNTWNEKQRADAAAKRPRTPAQASASVPSGMQIPSMDDDEDARPTVVVERRDALGSRSPDALTKPNQTKPNRSDPDLPLPVLKASAPDLPRSEARAEVWNGRRWLEAFSPKWCEKYGGTQYGGGEDAAKACGRLSEQISELATADALAAQARAGAMIAEFLADDEPKVVKARHPFSWLVTRWNGLRFVAPVANDPKHGAKAVFYPSLSARRPA